MMNEMSFCVISSSGVDKAKRTATSLKDEYKWYDPYDEINPNIHLIEIIIDHWSTLTYDVENSTCSEDKDCETG